MKPNQGMDLFEKPGVHTFFVPVDSAFEGEGVR